MGDISTRYNAKLKAMKTTPGDAKDFVDMYVTDDGKSAKYTEVKSAEDGNIAKTKTAIKFYKNTLSTLSSTQAKEDEDLVDKYINVMANFHYLRMAMTIFILLQQKKIETNSAEIQGKQAAEEAIKDLQTIPGVEGKDVAGIKKYIEDLQKQNKDLSELIKTSIPIVAEIDATAFGNALN